MSIHVSNQLSPPQRAVLIFVAGHMQHNGYAPTIREICDNAGISSTSMASYYLDALERKGYISRTPSISRSIVPDWDRINEMLGEAAA